MPGSPSRHPLVPHPSALPSQVEEVHVELGIVSPGWVDCTFRVRPGSARLRIPSADTSLNSERLWEHTCCELFIAQTDPAYEEWNFSPTGQHAHFEFERYRRRRAEPLRLPAKIPLDIDIEGSTMSLHARVPAISTPMPTSIHVGAAVVLEHHDGALSYWALQHSSDAPDFHVRNDFVVELGLD